MLMLAVVPLGSCGDAPTAGRAPNLVVISVDTLNRDALPAFDQAAQPLDTLDRFADGAARFTQAFSTASWTLPAQTSLLTGVYPHRHGAVHPHSVLRDEVPTVAEPLRASGYTTVAFTDGGFVHHKYGLGRGFHRYDDLIDAGSGSGGFFDRGSGFAGIEIPRGGRPNPVFGQDLFDRARAFLEQRGSGRPFFLFLQTYSVHDYFKVHPWVVEVAPPSREDYLGCLLGRVRCEGEDWTHLRLYYQAEVRRIDLGLARLFSTLRRTLGDEPTYVVFISDHGEGFAVDAGRIHHGGYLHDDLIRIPLLIDGPDVEQRSIDAPVSLVDIAPTLLDLAGLEPPGDLDGRSLVPLLRGERQGDPRPLVALEHTYFWEQGVRNEVPRATRRPLALAVVSGEYRWVESYAGEALFRVDGDEYREVPAPVVGPLLGRLRRVARQVQREAAAVVERPLDREMRDDLKSLGYL